jgi:hypothetical protein
VVRSNSDTVVVWPRSDWSVIRTDVRPVCPAGLHVEGVLVICSRGTRVLVSLGKGEALTYPLGRVPTPKVEHGAVLKTFRQM